jgi:predicted nuclease with TOPRIM domain
MSDYARNASTQGEALHLHGELELVRAERDALREELERVRARLRLVKAARQHNVERNEELTAEVERLRGALEQVRDNIGVPDASYPSPLVTAYGLINAALASNDTQEGT